MSGVASSSSKCPLSSRVPQGFGYALQIGNSTPTSLKQSSPSLSSSPLITNCAIPCKHGLLSAESRKSLLIILVLVTSLSICLLLYGLLSHLLSISSKLARYYPERATIFILACHIAISLCLLISSLNQEYFGCHEINGVNFRVQKNNNTACTIIHSILLYFFIASQIWWMIYCLCIFMISSAQWISETISLKSHIFHAVAWVLPAVITFFSLLFESISSDLATGVCFINIQKASEMAIYFAIPLTISMSFGIFLILISLCNLVKIRRQFTSSANNSMIAPEDGSEGGSGSPIIDRIHDCEQEENAKNPEAASMPIDDTREKMLANQLRSMDNYLCRTTLFSLLYFLLNILLLCSFLLESHRRPDWNAEWHTNHCTSKDGEDCGVLKATTVNESTKEILALSIAKYVSWQLAGWASLIYVTSRHAHKRWILLCSNPFAFFAAKERRFV